MRVAIENYTKDKKILISPAQKALREIKMNRKTKILTASKNPYFNFIYLLGNDFDEKHIKEVKIDNRVFKVKSACHYYSITDIPSTVLDVDTEEDLKKYKNFEIELIY